MVGSDLTNLWKETVAFLKENGKGIDDIVFIYGNGYEIDVDDFVRIAKACDYDAGFGGQRIPGDLSIVGDDWWMERREYDGSEWWEFLKKPERPSQKRKLEGFRIYEYDIGKYDYGEQHED